nr:immunoglobulin heavy chain junction region [Mus musculus]MBK4196985.1 immunoglobulin heavy chain junction region [Mus musculus]MBK4196986.1 immunoglobulin heavy chain junction region [Mus musculus]MBK4196987.1 immunoglobulin heavy chain junction region [Mus musculus]MBK4196988.1 immunoglobulin heavy chain junction region [Mus musculus]
CAVYDGYYEAYW